MTHNTPFPVWIFKPSSLVLDQLYIRDDKMTISDLIKGAAKTIGEPITVVRFVRIQLGAE